MSEPTPGDYPLCTHQYDVWLGESTAEVTCDAGVIGRYVWIQSAGNSDISLYEVKVYAGW